jgi:hypothetical protein
LQEYSKARLGRKAGVGAIVAIQTYGDQLNWHPHLHSIVSDVAWDSGDHPHPLGAPEATVLTGLFRHHVLKMLEDQRRLSWEFGRRLRSWEPSGFQVFCGRPVACEETPALERLTAYIPRPSFAGTRLQFDPQEGQIEYHTSKGIRRRMDALDWIAPIFPMYTSKWCFTMAVTRMLRAASEKRKLPVFRYPAAPVNQQSPIPKQASRENAVATGPGS